jgi:predicted dehydrogenase
MWKNRFTFEVFGRDGYALVEGLGGSYGVESLTIGRKMSAGSVPEETVTRYEQPDESWDKDWRDLTASIEEGRDAEVGAEDGLAVMQLVDEVYTCAAKTRQPERVHSRP